MSWKKLNSDSDRAQSLLLGEGQSLLQISFGDKEDQFYLVGEFIKLSDSELEILYESNSVKFLGDDKHHKRFEELPVYKKKLSKSIALKNNEKLEAWYYPDKNKVRIPKKVEVVKYSGAKSAQPATKKKVLIVDDSKTIQKLISKIVSISDKLDVMAVASSAMEAKEIIEKEIPDIITLDIHMPEMNGVDFLKNYLQYQKIPTVMISSISVNEGPLVIEALSNGAMGYIQKPSMNDIGTVAPEIREKLENIAATRGNVSGGMQPVKKASISFAHDNSIIAIGSSTGGTQALQRIFRSFPKEIPPVLVVQHIPAVFSKAFADRLNSICPFRVKEAEDGEKVEKNTVYIAPGGLQFKVRKRKVYLTDDAPVNRFKPSVDYLFNDLASRDEESIVAVMLTGMGKDGAAGMLKLKNKGALTLAQNEESCVVFGMPKEAIRAGGVDQVVHLDDMAEKIIEVYNSIEVKKKAS